MFFFFKLSVDKLLECLELVAGSTLSGFLCNGYKFFAEVNLLTGAQLLACFVFYARIKYQFKTSVKELV